MKEIKFSVIIPVYNGENYITRSMLSIINQTYSNWEMIIVNDGSKDNTANVVQKVIKQNEDKSIIYKEIKNSGPSTARNLGLSIAKGDYVCFLDSDDEYDHSLFEKLNKKEELGDVCFFGWKEVFEDNSEKRYSDTHEFIDQETGYDVLIKKFNRKLWLCNCNEVYKRSLLIDNNICYPEGVFSGEDTCFIYTSLMYANLVCCLKDDLFINYIRDNSLMRSVVSEKDLTEFMAIDIILDNISKCKVLEHDQMSKLTKMFLAYKEYVNIAIAKKLSKEFSVWKYFKFKKKLKTFVKTKIDLKLVQHNSNKNLYKQALLYNLCPMLMFLICKIKYKRKK